MILLKKACFTLDFLIMIFLFFTLCTFVQSIPPYINYQGRLVDQITGIPVNGEKTITFSLYNSETGEIPIYQQTKQVTITNGIFSSYFGQGAGYYNGNPVTDGIPPEVFTECSARYLGIKINGSPLEIIPRQLIASVAYAFKAGKAKEAEIVIGQMHSSTIDSTPIGGNIPADGTFTTLKTKTDPTHEDEIGNKGYNDRRYAAYYEVDALRTYGEGVYYVHSTLQSAIEDIGLDEKTLLLQPGIWNITSEIPPIPENISLKFSRGAILNLGPEITVTIRGQIEAGMYTIFSGNGTVDLSSGAVKEVYPYWWGFGQSAEGEDNVRTLSAAIAAAGGKPVVLTDGEFKLQGTISHSGNIHIRGNINTILIPQGVNSFLEHNIIDGYLHLEEITFRGSAYKGSYVLVRGGNYSSTYAITQLKNRIFIKDCRFEDTNIDTIGIGIKLLNSNPGDALYYGVIDNCSFKYLGDCIVMDTGGVESDISGWRISDIFAIHCRDVIRTNKNAGRIQAHHVENIQLQVDSGQAYLADVNKYCYLYWQGSNSTFINCYFMDVPPSQDAKYYFSIFIDRGKSNTFLGGYYAGSYGGIYDKDAEKNNIVTGNQYINMTTTGYASYDARPSALNMKSFLHEIAINKIHIFDGLYYDRASVDRVYSMQIPLVGWKEETTGSGAITQRGTSAILQTNNMAYSTAQISNSSYFIPFGKNHMGAKLTLNRFYWEMPFQMNLYLVRENTCPTGEFRFALGQDCSGKPTEKSIGFKIEDTALYGFAHDGTDESSILLKELKSGAAYHLRLWWQGTQICFSVEGENWVTLSENIPSGSDISTQNIYFYTTNGTTPSNYKITILYPEFKFIDRDSYKRN